MEAHAWSFPPNWQSSVEMTYAFRTEIMTSRSKREQRRALRQKPRRSMRFSAVANETSFRAFVREMVSWQHKFFWMPEWTRFVRTTVQAFPGGTVVSLDEIPSWVEEDRAIVFVFEDGASAYTVASISGNQVTLDSQIEAVIPSGAKVYPALPGHVPDQVSTRQPLARTSRIIVDFEVAPGLAYDIAALSPGTMFDGLEVFDWRPNWAQQPTVSFESYLEKVDYGFGRASYFTPVDFNTRLNQLTFLSQTRDRMDEILAFFCRMRGQQGEFYAPTFTHDIEVFEDIDELESTLVVEGEDFADAYTDDPVNCAICIRLDDGVQVRRKVTSIEVVGGNSVMTVNAPWDFDIPLSRILMVSWMPRWRFASDEMTVEWITDEVAQTVFNMRSIEAVEGD